MQIYLFLASLLPSLHTLKIEIFRACRFHYGMSFRILPMFKSANEAQRLFMDRLNQSIVMGNFSRLLDDADAVFEGAYFPSDFTTTAAQVTDDLNLDPQISDLELFTRVPEDEIEWWLLLYCTCLILFCRYVKCDLCFSNYFRKPPLIIPPTPQSTY